MLKLLFEVVLYLREVRPFLTAATNVAIPADPAAQLQLDDLCFSVLLLL